MHVPYKHKISLLCEETFYVTTHVKFPLHGKSRMSFCVVISQTSSLVVAQLIGYTCTVSILCSNVRVLVANLVKTSDWDGEDPSLNLQRNAHDFRPQSTQDLHRLIARSRKNCRQLLIRKYWQVLFCTYLLT